MHAIPALLVVASSVCVSLGAVALLNLGPPRDGPALPPPDPATAQDRRVDDLLVRFEALDQRMLALESRASDVRTVVREREPAPVGDSVARLAAVEQRLQALDSLLLSPDEAWVCTIRPDLDPAQRAAVLPRASDVILDPAASVAEKISAHKRLRRVKDAYTPAMVQELLRIAASSSEAQVRADVWCLFDGESKVPALVPPLLHALAMDGEDIVRAEAAETLGNYLADPVVLNAVRWAAVNDTAERVRNKAQRTLQDANYR